ncbi:GNAT family N-acetyltransferase, partial [bacterium M00.F.Ca.ET.194.01.1.1]
PIWSALATRHRVFAEGGDLARRYRPSIVPFAATAADDAESLRALGRLLPPLESSILVQTDPIVLPAELAPVSTASLVQMVAEQPVQAVSDERVQRLARGDAAEMLALASLTKPGPFTLEALSLGEFWGVKIDGRLAAMAGE